MLSIGVVTRGKYGIRLLDTITQYTGFTATSVSIPIILPKFIDDPASFVNGMGLNEKVLSSDLILTYSLHPDITPEVVLRAARAGSKAVLIPGGRSRAGDPCQLRRISEQYHIKLVIEEICCEIRDDTDSTINEFNSILGSPLLEVWVDDGIISDVRVIRGAPCGSTWWMAEQLKGVLVDEAPAKAGLLIQQYPCRAIRGTLGGIHRSAQLHKKAVEDAIRT
ncbi:MAG: DUF166 domain-containing protein [Euryarchaeota archaeon]|nr:DUF166 domain-containing protein [Euryarchaeota archaeon]